MTKDRIACFFSATRAFIPGNADLGDPQVLDKLPRVFTEDL
jgi:hypothetical protein